MRTTRINLRGFKRTFKIVYWENGEIPPNHEPNRRYYNTMMEQAHEGHPRLSLNYDRNNLGHPTLKIKHA